MFIDPQSVSAGNFDGTAGSGLFVLNNGVKPARIRQISIASTTGTFTVTVLEARGPGYGADNTERISFPLPVGALSDAIIQEPGFVPVGWALVLITTGLGALSAAQAFVYLDAAE